MFFQQSIFGLLRLESMDAHKASNTNDNICPDCIMKIRLFKKTNNETNFIIFIPTLIYIYYHHTIETLIRHNIFFFNFYETLIR